MLKKSRLLLLAAFLLLGGYLRAASLHAVTIGLDGINTVSHATQFLTGDANLWRSRHVRVYDTRVREIKKTRWNLRHLKPGSMVDVDDELVRTKELSLSEPQTASQICSHVKLWMCRERLASLGNPGSADLPSAKWTVPVYFPEISQPVRPQREREIVQPRTIQVTVLQPWYKYWQPWLIIAILTSLLAVVLWRFLEDRSELEFAKSRSTYFENQGRSGSPEPGSERRIFRPRTIKERLSDTWRSKYSALRTTNGRQESRRARAYSETPFRNQPPTGHTTAQAPTESVVTPEPAVTAQEEEIPPAQPLSEQEEAIQEDEDPRSRTRRISRPDEQEDKSRKVSKLKEILSHHGVDPIVIEDALWPKVEILIPDSQEQQASKALEEARQEILTNETFSIQQAEQNNSWYMVNFKII